MKPVVEYATLDDLDALAPLFDGYRQFYGQPSDIQRAHDWLKARIGQQQSMVLLAKHDGEPAGFTQLYPMYSSVRTTRIWVLNDLFVAAGFRRHGVARALLDAATEFAKEDGAAFVMLETTRDNDAARALYRAAGWQEDETQWYSRLL
ncbi:GNAT family N-acetyltransferase [Solilutibacter silvestris]|uniref:Acetyltransferase (GNAT) family n=1 Tax=Solilutibacter silvestris TaxID=1645665 RepID=A0A2K1PXQ1_9GAMM|nr:GNAT family N-acetyltransferase [Lysobacter silvestris]PNS07551.1 Acetyltransferase (GNAT) family [Lysobacter silvestris]